MGFLEEISKLYSNFTVPSIQEFIKLKCVSPNFDSRWKNNQQLYQAIQYCTYLHSKLDFKNSKSIQFSQKGYPPALLITFEAYKSSKNVLFYGSIDKMMPMEEDWTDKKQPFKPQNDNDKLYGRQNNGWSIFTILGVIKAMQNKKIQMPRICVLIETEGLSYSQKLPDIINLFQNKYILKPDYIICLNSGCLDYENFYVTTSCKSSIDIDLKITVQEKGYHSGLGSGIIPDCFRILLDVMNQIESVKFGDIYMDLKSEIPNEQYKQMQELYNTKNQNIKWNFPVQDNVQTVQNNYWLSYLNRSWNPQMNIIGQNGIPSVSNGGNVLNPFIELNLNFNFAPNIDIKFAENLILENLNNIDVLYNAQIQYNVKNKVQGTVIYNQNDNLTNILKNIGQEIFQKPTLYYSEGMQIGVLNILKNTFPESQIIVSGINGPDCNQYGGDENLNLKYLARMMLVLGRLLQELGKIKQFIIYNYLLIHCKFYIFYIAQQLFLISNIIF